MRMISAFALPKVFGAAVCALLLATSVSAPAEVQRHPLETRALTDPKGVLRELPALIKLATTSNDAKQLALLHLAEANACRVIADWSCQSNAGARANIAAKAAKLPELQARGLILESRGRLATQDFSRSAQLLGEAERLLVQHPFAELSADVYLAHSSLSHMIGKHAKAAEYAVRGLSALGEEPALLVRIRLLRNQARALTQLGKTAEGRAALKQALVLVEQLDDPKLSAELNHEDARIARLLGDIPTQVANGERILVLGGRLSNSQITGLGREVLGLAALDKGDKAAAERELRLAYRSFRELRLERDERRVLRTLIRSLLERGGPRAELETLVTRLFALDATLESSDRALAADDFEARLKYAQQELEVQRLEAAAALAAERATAAAEQQRLTLIVALLSFVLLLVFVGLFVQQRRFNVRLKHANAQLRSSEHHMRAITDNVPAMIARVDTEQRYTFVNAALGRVFGVKPRSVIGKTIRDVRGDVLYAEVEAHIETALRGQPVSFEGEAEVNGQHYSYQSNYVPDRDTDGKVQGFFALTFDITAQKRAEAELVRLARIDSLTGVANRRYFEERMNASLAHSRRRNQGLALLCLDIDHFKSINDNHGHPVGDAVIVAFAERLRGCVREDDLVARLGGDEFVLLIENPQADSGENIAKKLLTIMEQPIIIDGISLQVSASIGVANSTDSPSTKALMDLADEALYRAKAAGRNTYRLAAVATDGVAQ